MSNRAMGTAWAVLFLGLTLLSAADGQSMPVKAGVSTALDPLRGDDDIIFQDRLEAEVTQVPGESAERIVAASTLSSDPNSLAALGEQAVFTLQAISNREIWFSDGSDNGTYAIELPEGYEDVTVHGHAVRGQRLYFFASPSFGVTDIWATDGTEAGTELVVDGAALGLSHPVHQLTVFGEAMAFWAFHEGARRVFLLDPESPAGARELASLEVNGGTSRAMASLGGSLYVSGWLNDVRSLVRVDTDGGTTLAWELEPVGDDPPVMPGDLTVSAGALYFAASQGEGVALWRHSPGAGTQRLFVPFGPDVEMRGASNLTAATGRLYFFTRPWNPDTNDFAGWRLAVTTGTPEGTEWYWPPLDESGVSNAPNVPTAGLGTRMLFRAEVTNGTAAGTGPKHYDGAPANIRPDHTVPGVDGIWLTATSGAGMAFAGFNDSDSFIVNDPSDLRLNNNVVNLAMVDGLPWMIARSGFIGGWEIWRIAPDLANND